MTRLRQLFFAMVVLCPLLSGCGDTYLGSIILGELRLLSSVQPIMEGLDDPTLSEEQRLKLAFVIRARDHAEDVVGLNVGTSYQTFANLGDDSLAWNLSASRKDAFDPYIWRFPFVGALPYIGFFNYEQAVAERDRLVKQDYDTLIYEVDAFSTLGRLPDPVTSALLRRNLASLADTVFHELTHNTIYHLGDITFNESMATFVGRTAGLEFLAVEFGPDAPEIAEAIRSYEDDDRFQEFLAGMKEELELLYAGDLSYEDKLAQREVIFEAARQRFGTDVLPLMHNQAGYKPYTSFLFNNAFLLAHVRYNHDQDVFAAIHESTGRNWAETLRIFADAAATPNPTDYLRSLITN